MGFYTFPCLPPLLPLVVGFYALGLFASASIWIAVLFLWVRFGRCLFLFWFPRWPLVLGFRSFLLVLRLVPLRFPVIRRLASVPLCQLLRAGDLHSFREVSRFPSVSGFLVFNSSLRGFDTSWGELLSYFYPSVNLSLYTVLSTFASNMCTVFSTELICKAVKFNLYPCSLGSQFC